MVTRGAVLFWIWCAVFGATVTAVVTFLGWLALIAFVAGILITLLAAWLIVNHEEYEDRSEEFAETATHDCNEHAW